MHQTVSYPHTDLIDAEIAHTALGTLSISRVVNYLIHVFKVGDDQVIFHRTEGDLMITPSQLGAYFNRLDLRAVAVRLTFWGGPPGVRGWYEGSLLTYMIDRLFRSIENGQSEMVEAFLRGVRQ